MVATTNSHFEAAFPPPSAVEEPSRIMIEFLESAVIRRRSFEQVVEDWRGRFPQLATWRVALDTGLIAISHPERRGGQVRLTAAGLRALRTARRNRALQQQNQRRGQQ